MFFEDNIDNAKYCGHLYGLGTSFVVNGNNYHDNGDSNSTSWFIKNFKKKNENSHSDICKLLFLI